MEIQDSLDFNSKYSWNKIALFHGGPPKFN
jgi:hypothetical protein